MRFLGKNGLTKENLDEKTQDGGGRMLVRGLNVPCAHLPKWFVRHQTHVREYFGCLILQDPDKRTRTTRGGARQLLSMCLRLVSREWSNGQENGNYW